MLTPCGLRNVHQSLLSSLTRHLLATLLLLLQLLLQLVVVHHISALTRYVYCPSVQTPVNSTENYLSLTLPTCAVLISAWTCSVTGCKRLMVCIALQGISEPGSVTCHMRSHSVSCHLTQVNASTLTPAMQAGTRFICFGWMEGWVILGGWLYTEMTYLWMFTNSHPSK